MSTWLNLRRETFFRDDSRIIPGHMSKDIWRSVLSVLYSYSVDFRITDTAFCSQSSQKVVSCEMINE